MIPFALFLAVSVGSLALLLALSEFWKPDLAIVRRRLAGEHPAAQEASATPLYKNTTDWESEVAPNASNTAAKTRKESWLDLLMREAEVPVRPHTLLAAVLLSACVIGTVASLVFGWLAGAIVYFLSVFFPVIVLMSRRQRRRDRYVKQLADAFELMARVLKSGQPVQEALRAAVATAQEPLASEFAVCLHEIEHGIRPEEAYRELSNRAGIHELKIFIVVMAIQRQTGGSLTEALERLAALIRTRLKLRQKIRALTAEGRMQSTTLLCLPIVTFFVMYFLNRAYAEALLTQWKLLLATATCMGVGVLWIRNIMKFEG